MTLVWFRNWFKNLLYKLGSSIDQSELKCDNAAEKLLRRGTTQGFSAEVLSCYGYDKATFSEAALPGYKGHAAVPDDEDAVGEDESTGTNNAEPLSRNQIRDSSVQFVSANGMPLGAAQVPSPSRSSQKSFRTTDDVESEKVGDDEDDGHDDRHSSYSDAKEDIGIRNDQAELYLQAHASTNIFTQANPVAAQAMNGEFEESALESESPEKRDGGRPMWQASFPGCEHEYTWPEASGSYDLREMDALSAMLKQPLQVLWTVFPGVKVRPPGSTLGMRAYKGMKATVKVKKVRGAGV